MTGPADWGAPGLFGQDACLKCSLCVAACPVVRVDPAFAGPKAYGPELARFGGAARGGALEDISACTHCSLCEAACPAEVPVAHLIARHKEGRGTGRRWRDRMLAHPERLGRLRPLARPLGAVARSHAARAALGWVGVRPAALDLAARLAHAPGAAPSRATSASVAVSPPRGERTVRLYVDCFTAALDPAAATAAERLLRAVGVQPLRVGEGTCCGAAAVASGQPAAAAAIAGHTRTRVGRAEEGPLLTLAAACHATIDQDWPGLFGDSAAGEGQQAPGTVQSLATFLLERVRASAAARRALAPAGEVSAALWHATCRSRGTGEDADWEELFRMVLGAVPTATGLACCGAGGAYAFKAEHARVADALGEEARLATASLPSGPVLTDSGTCAFQLARFTGRPVLHPATFLAGVLAPESQEGGQHS